MAFLDYTGLTRFWDKVKDYIASHSGGRGNAKIFVGTCDTAGWTAEKVVTCSDYDQLVAGDKIYVTFTYTNTASTFNLKLNVNGTGAKKIQKKGSTSDGPDYNDLPRASMLNAGSEVLFTYSGTYWVLSAATAAYAQNINYTDGANRSLIVSDSQATRTDLCSMRSLNTSSELYVSGGKLYQSGHEVLTDVSYDFDQFLQKIDAVDVRHDQYLYGLESNEYRVVLRIFFVDTNGNILQRNPDTQDITFLDGKNYSVSIKAYDSLNNIIETYFNNEWLQWEPTTWNDWYDLDSYGIYPTRYWLELTAKFVPPSGLHHIAVSFNNLDQDLYMYNQNQDLTFNITSLSHDTVEIKNVGLVYANGLSSFNGNYYGTGYRLPNETVNVPQIWSSSLEEAELIRGYSYAVKPYNADDVDVYWITMNPEDETQKITDKLVVHDGKFFYTTGYFEIPITEDSGSVQSNQGVANAGKFLMVNSNGIVEPVSMT